MRATSSAFETVMTLFYYMHAYCNKCKHIVKQERHDDIDTPKSIAVRPLIVGAA
jgi:uncharacterized paraquat-inducible protein A